MFKSVKRDNKTIALISSLASKSQVGGYAVFLKIYCLIVTEHKKVNVYNGLRQDKDYFNLSFLMFYCHV